MALIRTAIALVCGSTAQFAKMSLLMKVCVTVVNVLFLPLHLLDALGLYRVYKRFMPLCLHHLSKKYNEKMHDKKKELFRTLPELNKNNGHLTILEIGCGTGTNFEFYPPGSKVICTDPNPHFQKYLSQNMNKNDHLMYERFLVASGEDLSAVEDQSVDAVVCTLVLCSVNNTPQTLREVHRILRPVSVLLGVIVVNSLRGVNRHFGEVQLK